MSEVENQYLINQIDRAAASWSWRKGLTQFQNWWRGDKNLLKMALGGSLVVSCVASLWFHSLALSWKNEAFATLGITAWMTVCVYLLGKVVEVVGMGSGAFLERLAVAETSMESMLRRQAVVWCTLDPSFREVFVHLNTVWARSSARQRRRVWKAMMSWNDPSLRNSLPEAQINEIYEKMFGASAVEVVVDRSPPPPLHTAFATKEHS